MMIEESDSDKMSRFISKESGDLKIEYKYKSDCIIVSQGKFSLICDDKNKTRNMATVQNLAVSFLISRISI
jgi:outer membrane lipoprotein-sorting protein